MKKDSYASLKPADEPSLNEVVITDCTVVVAMAAALASVGAAIELKLTPLKLQPLPHKATVAGEAAMAEDKGNMGTAASSCSARRREVKGCSVI
jgi:hypothetical protein